MTSIGGPSGIGGARPPGGGGVGGVGGVGGEGGTADAADLGAVEGAGRGAADVEGLAGPGSGAARLDAADRAAPVAAGAGPSGAAGVSAPERAAAGGELDALFAEVDAGRLTAREAVDRLVEATAGADLAPEDRADLLELLRDLADDDPYLAGLADRI